LILFLIYHSENAKSVQEHSLTGPERV